MDFDLSPEHLLLRQTIRDFAVNEVEPVVEEHERERRFPTDIVAMLGPMGLLGIPYPEDEGGAGLDTLAYAIAVEELSRVWGSLGIIVAAHTSLGCGPLHLAGTPEQKERWLVPMAQGRVLGAYGLTEPEAGSDSGGTRTTARHEDGPDGGSWVIDGRKRFITNAGQAGTYIVTARTGSRDDGSPEISAFIVPAEHAGLQRRAARGEDGPARQRHRRAALRGLPRAGRADARRAGRGLEDLPQDPRRRAHLDRRHGRRAGPGGARCFASRYARERQQFGRPIGSFQGVAFMIADMATEIDAARAMVWRAAWLKDQGRDYGLAAAEAKLFASEVANRATNNGVQVHGGYGYVEEYKVERFLRDAKLTEIGEGTSQIQRLVIGRRVLGLKVV